MSTIKIKRLYNQPPASFGLYNLAPGELGYTGWDNRLYIGNASGNGNILINDFSDIFSEIYSLEDEALSEVKLTVENEVLQLTFYNIDGKQVYKLALDHVHSSYVNQNAFGKVNVNGTTITADEVVDTLSLIAGDNIVLTADATNDKITIKATDTTYTLSNTTGANPTVKLTDNNENPQNIQIVGSGATTVTGANGKITISSTDNNTTYTAGSGLKLSGTQFNHANSIQADSIGDSGSNRQLAFGGSFNIPKIDYDSEGHIFDATNVQITLPAAPTIPTLSKGTDKTGTAVTVTPNANKKATFTAITDTSVSGHTVTDTNTTFTLDLSGFTTTGEISSAMVFKGTLGTNGTYTTSTFPAASTALQGDTYKVITAGTYRGVAAKVGDVLVCDGSTWVLIPSGDEPSGTVTNIATGTGLTGGPITSTGTISVKMSSTALGASGALGAASTTSKVYGVQPDKDGNLAVYVPWSNTTYSAATTSAAGLMSATDKAKLDGIAAQANKYSLPTASSSTLGGVKIGSNINISSGVISVPAASGSVAGVTIVYPAASCTTFTSDSGTCTPLAVKKAVGMFEPKAHGHNDMKGATSSAAGTAGFVPAPAAGKQTSFLRGDGTWVVPTDTNTKVTNTLATTTKAYVTGTTSETTNTGTQVFDTGVYLDTTAGRLTADSLVAVDGVYAGDWAAFYESGNYTYVTGSSADEGIRIGHNTGYTNGAVVGVYDKNTKTYKEVSTVGHTHNYAGSSSAGGAATSANKVNANLAIKLNGGTTEGTNLFTFNGSAAKTVNITPSAIGAATSGHNHNGVYVKGDYEVKTMSLSSYNALSTKDSKTIYLITS